jgi:UDP-N-acetylglucosamine enolpyruvyl transferase
MPDYASLTSQVELFKTKVAALSGSSLGAQELVYLAKAIESMGNLLGVNDVLAATNTKLNDISNAVTGAVTTVSSAGSTQVAAVAAAGATQVAAVANELNNFTIYQNMGVI